MCIDNAEQRWKFMGDWHAHSTDQHAIDRIAANSLSLSRSQQCKTPYFCDYSFGLCLLFYYPPVPYLHSSIHLSSFGAGLCKPLVQQRERISIGLSVPLEMPGQVYRAQEIDEAIRTFIFSSSALIPAQCRAAQYFCHVIASVHIGQIST